MKKFILVAMLAINSTLAFALPTVDEVQSEVKHGNYQKAETMMQEVVAAKDKSAKAHYIFAEILAHNARFDRATTEVRRARELDPTLHFTDPEKFKAFEELLTREQRNAKRQSSEAVPPVYDYTSPATNAGGSIPGWMWGAGGGLLAVLLWRLFAGSRASAPTAPYGASRMGGGSPGYSPAGGAPAYNPAPPNYGPGAPVASPAPGSGMLGMGLAGLGGVAAGMLAEKMIEGHRDHNIGQGLNSTRELFPSDTGAAVFRDEAANELERRSVDFGSGDSWGGDDGSSSSSIDTGSSGSGDW